MAERRIEGYGLWQLVFMLLIGFVGGLVSGCDGGKAGTAPPRLRSSAKPNATSAVALPVDVVEVAASDEPLAELVPRELARARQDGRQLLVYVGAPWCEPCKRFHDAAKAGKLDRRLSGLRLLEFDHDRDEARLRAADCTSRLIPLFARPNADGSCSERRVFGSVKGPAAVENIAPRLQQLLATP